MRASRSVSKRCVRSLANLMASFVKSLLCATKPSTSMPRKTMVFSEKCENASVLTVVLPLVPALPQNSRNASIHCSEGVSLSVTRTCPCSSTSRPSALIEVLMLPGILAHGFGPSAEDDLLHARSPINQAEIQPVPHILWRMTADSPTVPEPPQPVDSERQLRLRYAGTCSGCG